MTKPNETRSLLSWSNGTPPALVIRCVDCDEPFANLELARAHAVPADFDREEDLHDSFYIDDQHDHS